MTDNQSPSSVQPTPQSHCTEDGTNYHATGVVAMVLNLLEAMEERTLWHLAQRIELEMIRRRREDVEDSRAIASMYSYSGPSFVELQRLRSTFTSPALSPEEILTRARQSWAHYDTRRAA